MVTNVALAIYKAPSTILAILRHGLQSVVYRITFRIFSNLIVQTAIADAIKGDTPLCDVLAQAVEDRLSELDTDDIHGLDRHIERQVEDALNNLELDASSIRDFDREVERSVDELMGKHDFIDDVTTNVFEELRARLK